ncbi:hypothetical protein BVC71_00150 [Marivivens niveibacter]|uniref:HTH marR-type domain-containing protein n=2 Tax=Marivivens niveibacter TaxID=1930667 RepID=A0A251X019_9RHOB|nr:hypothetical protein BVC71_00150 [Marivivens niveibacter]
MECFYIPRNEKSTRSGQMPHPPQTIVEFATRFAISAELYQTVLQDRLRPKGLTLPQLSVLSHIARQQRPQRVTDIARTVQVGQPAVTKMVSKFHGAGWVDLVDAPNDQRVKFAQITAKGAEHLMTTQRSLLPELKPFLDQYGSDDINTVLKILNDFSNMLESFKP